MDDMVLVEGVDSSSSSKVPCHSEMTFGIDSKRVTLTIDPAVEMIAVGKGVNPQNT